MVNAHYYSKICTEKLKTTGENNTVVRSSDDGCQHPKHVERLTEM